MQAVVLDHSNSRKPSKTLEKLIDNCVSDFSKLNKSVNRVLEQGRKEGFTDLETGKLIRQKLIVAGFSDRTARRYLPSSAKGKQGGASMRSTTHSKTDNLAVISGPRAINNKANNTTKNGQDVVLHHHNRKTDKMSVNVISTIEFHGKFSSLGKDRFVICVPKHLNAEVVKRKDRELRISIQ